jgi:hypothetical protein
MSKTPTFARNLLVLAALAGVAALAGCPSDDPDTDPQEGDTDTDTDADTDADTDTDTDTDTDPGPVTSVTGTIYDGTGSVLSGAAIRFCRGELCLTPTPDASGVFTIPEVQAFPHSFEVLVPGSTTRATGLTVVELEEGVPKTLAMYVPNLDAPSPLNATAEWHDVGTGLRVQLAEDDLETPPFFDPATEVAGVRLDSQYWPTIDGLTNVHAVWFLEPFDYPAANAGIPVEIDNDLGLTAGGTYEVYVGDYTTSEWILAGTVTENAGVLTGDALLPLMSTVVLTDPQ